MQKTVKKTCFLGSAKVARALVSGCQGVLGIFEGRTGKIWAVACGFYDLSGCKRIFGGC